MKKKMLIDKIWLVIVFLLLMTNIFFYLHYNLNYMNVYSATLNYPRGLGSSQTIYTIGSGSSDNILVDLITNKDLNVYGDKQDCYIIFEYYAKSVHSKTGKIKWSQLDQKKDAMLQLGTMNLSRFYDLGIGMTGNEAERIKEKSVTYRSQLYVYNGEVSNANTLVCIVDEEYNIYVMDEGQAEVFIYE